MDMGIYAIAKFSPRYRCMPEASAQTGHGKQAMRSRCRTRQRWRWGWPGLLCAFCLAGLGGVGPGHAADSDPAAAIVGDWLVASRDAVIRISRVGNEFEGRILWQLHDSYGPEDGPALNGKIVTDRNNPDPARRSQPLTGLRMIWSLHYDVDDKMWKGGRVYDADNGHTYDCQIRLINPDRLKLRGYIGISLLGGSTEWSRVTMTATPHGGLPFVMRSTGG